MTSSCPFAKEFVTDAQGRVVKVILDWNEYKNLIELLEEEGLHRAMMEVKEEVPIELDEALAQLEEA